MAEGRAFDEMNISDGTVRPPYDRIAGWLRDTPVDLFKQKRIEAEILFRRIGITFAVYGEGGDPERLIPFDLVPRIMAAREWETLERGLKQRVRALNAFIADVYRDREIMKAGIVPEQHVMTNSAYRPEMQGVAVPGDIYSHVCGVDLVRTGEEEFYVLEDNCRTPSGVSYMLEDREVMMRLFPNLFAHHKVAPVDTYTDELLATLRESAPPACTGEPTVAILTPGIYNSAYYEHSFLADKMGVELVEGQDLFVDDNLVYMRTTSGPRKVDVIYRRVDDEFLDPLVYNPESALGIPGVMNVYRAGRVTLANAVGAGIADDKAIYTYVPEMVKFYLGEEAILKNVPTWRCSETDALGHVLDSLDELVVKEVHGSGGYGMLVGPHATKQEREEYAARIKASPADFIAQPTLALSTCPTFVESGVAPRHVDFRPYVLSSGDNIRLVKGGLTRVALKSGSLVVNSSQGGGTKDTWVLEE
ncbi:MAG: circularly permuted type 2 ATP-grasp protein [Alphaproteobacteria bacterium]